jgi:Flp pilus assembly CpaE family ATPase
MTVGVSDSRGPTLIAPSPTSRDGASPWLRASQLNVVVACGDAETEREVLNAIGGLRTIEGHPCRVVSRCLSARELLGALDGEGVDVAVVATDLHGLDRTAFGALERTKIRLLVLSGSGLGERRWDAANPRLRILPADAAADHIRDGLLSLARDASVAETRVAADARVSRHTSSVASVVTHQTATRQAIVLAVTAACSGVGSSTVAANLAAALGRRSETAVVEADLLAPSMAAALGLDPARNVYLVAHERPGDNPSQWAQAFAAELQPLDITSPHASVLCGVPRPSLRTAFDDVFAVKLLDVLSHDREFLVVDTPFGHEEGTASAALHAAMVEKAHRILVVTTPEVVNLRRTACLLEVLFGRATSDARRRVSLILNRFHSRHHPSPAEVAEVLKVPVAATIPEDCEPMQRALSLQRPVIAIERPRRGSAARALLELADLIAAARSDDVERESRARRSRPWLRWRRG